MPHFRLSKRKLVAAVAPVESSSSARETTYPTTPTLSLDAVHDSVTLVCVTEVAVRPLGFDGGCLSGHAAVDVVIVLRSERIPDFFSTASTANEYRRPQSRPSKVSRSSSLLPTRIPFRYIP